ncbi:hypothetical protein [Capnocytophaga sputigena]|uniref:hypothetical protein n=1 Tax=Capnocytophaga sputigena TaxID=1019 RepID=UPI001E5B44F5|nr:hypothetical protein [Capnocytophaga sputigena]
MTTNLNNPSKKSINKWMNFSQVKLQMAMRIAICSFWYLVGWAIGTGILYGCYNYYVGTQGVNLFYPLDKLLLFHCGISALTFVIILAVHLKRPLYTAFAFVAGFLLRLIAIIIFCLPLEKRITSQPLYELLFIILPTFYFIALETFTAIQLIKIKK